jgi:hypothetical protein
LKWKKKKIFDRSWVTLYSWNKKREAVIYDEHAGRMVEIPAFVEDGNTLGIATRYWIYEIGRASCRERVFQPV